MVTTDPHPTCGHEDCDTWLDTTTGEHVTYCSFAPETALEVAA
ncbi:hypothetical protein [Nocardia ignorata]|uniref:Uncharacterized protein n=1 Tax=Nocardia ignorata TaxID=145285 RepID=A0A4R6NZ59_NOCIG|nr:hypothetical protein [Nocardia ignorata]TDP29833.1 hypothetical protein DFR75_112101 [Nocardia ignorata]